MFTQRIKSPYIALRKLGLSKLAIGCYANLFEEGAASIPRLAVRLETSQSSLYRVLKDLEAKGFLTSVNSSDYLRCFYAEPINKALRAYADYQHRAVHDLVKRHKEILIKRSGR